MANNNARWGGPAEYLPTAPSYAKPPVAETSLAVRFAPSEDWGIDVLGSFRDVVRSGFTYFEALPPIRFEQAAAPFFIGSGIPPARGIYTNKERDFLIQVQDDMFAANWKRNQLTQKYPRYNELRKLFTEELSRYIDFRRSRGLSVQSIVGCQVTYINLLESTERLGYSDLWRGLLDQVATTDTGDARVPSVESINLAATFRAGPLKLVYTLAPALRVTDNTAVTQFSLVSSAEKVDPAGADLMGQMDLAHDLLISVFENLVSDAAKRAWERNP